MLQDKSKPIIREPDYEKLKKLEKLLLKIDGDIQKKAFTANRSMFVETIKKTHDIYQLVLGEMQFQLGELQLEQFGSILMKIYVGQNTLLNLLLKMQINVDFNPESMVQNLQQIQANKKFRRQNSSHIQKKKSFDEEPRFEQQQQNVFRMPGGGVSAAMQLSRPVQLKTGIDKATCTTSDYLESKGSKSARSKDEDIDAVRDTVDEGKLEIDKFLKDRSQISAEASNAEKNLKIMLKDLNSKKKAADEFAKEGEEMLKKEEENKKQIELLMKEGLKNKTNQPKAQKQAPVVLQSNQVMKNGQVITINHMAVNTEQDLVKDQLEKLRIEFNNINRKCLDLEKKYKEAKIDADVLTDQNKKLNSKIEEYHFLQEKRRQEDIKRMQDQQNQVQFGDKEKEKFKKFAEENIRLKLKMKDLIEQIRKLDDQNKQNMNKFKLFIQTSNLTEEQKRLLLGKADELFTSDLSKKFNLKEMEQMSTIDTKDILGDKFLKQVLGDPIQLVKKIKQEEQRKAQQRQNPNYNSEFDTQLLNENEEIITRKVMKKVKRKNSKGEMVEVEIEVEEEVVIDKRTGQEIRKRDKPQEGLVQDPTMQKFLSQHGGLAIGGAKFVIPPKVGVKPISKTGEQTGEGQWFVDQNGNKARVVKNSNGEEEYEIIEEYVDESGVKRTRVKKIKLKKDNNNNDIQEEEYIDPISGQKVKVEKRIVKDKEGNEIVEEILTGADGKKIYKKTKVKKDKDGNDIVEEEIMDEFGNKKIIRKKKMKDENGNEVVMIETVNADGSKTVIIEKTDSMGNKLITTEQIDKKGKKTVTEKRIKIAEDGKVDVEEILIDEKGNKKFQSAKVIIDENGNECLVEETQDENGNKIIKKKKIILDENGDRVEVEEIVDEFGNKITKKIKKIFDKQGNEIIEEEIIDKNGNKVIIKKKINQDGSVEEERYNPDTGEKVIVKRRVGENGQEIIEETKIGKDGKEVTVTKVISKDQNGNVVIQETFVDPKTGKKVTVTKKVTRDKLGKEQVEEIITDSNGNTKTIIKKVVKDKDGREVIEEEVVDSSGNKYKVRTKVYKDANGNEVIEEEKIDSNGNKVTIKRIKDKNGKELVEEIRIGKDGKKEVIQKVINSDGTVEETIINANGQIEKRFHRIGNDDKSVQVNLLDLESMLQQMGMDPKMVDLIAESIRKYIETGEPIVLGNEDLAKLKKEKHQHQLSVQNLKDANKKDLQDIRLKQSTLSKVQPDESSSSDEQDEEKLEVLDDNMNDDQQMEALYKKMKEKGAQMGELQRLIRNQLGLQGDDTITMDMFKDYLIKFKQVHSKCGDNCAHLKRFYSKLGFIQAKYKRKYLKMKDTKIKAFDKKTKLPKI